MKDVPISARLVDLHCHLDLYPDYPDSFEECDRDGVFTVAVTTTPKAWPRNRDLAASSRHVRAALGLHPQLVAERAKELALWEEYLPEAKYVGEVGLDAGRRFYRSFYVQKQVFQRVLRCCAAAGGKIVTVHSVRAATAVLDLIESNMPPDRGRVVLHWFTGSRAEAVRAVNLGCYFSINMEMLRSERHRDLVASLPMESLLTETDGPFTRHGERPTRPKDVEVAIEGIAQARKMEPESIALAVRRNLDVLNALAND